jgi:membrane protease YdiL (CAAX protease family)
VVAALHRAHGRNPLALAAALFAVLAAVRLAGAYDSNLMVASLALTPMVLLAVPRQRWRAVGLRAVRPRTCLGPALIVVVVYAAAAVQTSVAFGAGDDNWVAHVPRLFIEMAGAQWLGVALMLVNLAVVVPVLEELCYRGVLHEAVERRRGPAIAVVATASAWAFVHLGDYGLNPANVEVAVGAVASVLLMGLALGLCRVATGSVVAPMVAQGLANTLLVPCAMVLYA